MKIGRWGKLGRENWSCVHCGTKRTTTDNRNRAVTVAFHRLEDLKKHLDTNKCRASRGLDPIGNVSAKKSLSEAVAHDLSHPKYKSWDKDRAIPQHVFTCPKCSKKVVWKSRFEHFSLCSRSYQEESQS